MGMIDGRIGTEYLSCTLVEYLVGDGIHPGWLARQGYVALENHPTKSTHPKGRPIHAIDFQPSTAQRILLRG